MKRREALSMTGLALTPAIAGCVGGLLDDESVIDVDGTEVPLVSTETAAEWYEDDELETLYLDARPSPHEYDQLRIAGAEFSPAPSGLDSGDPAVEEGPETRIVTYCVCPHYYAGQRGAYLIDSGFEDVHALDEGLEDWAENGHPVAGTWANESLEEVSFAEPEYAN